MTDRKYRSTFTACFIGSVTQAAVVNLPPLLFIVFSTRLGISLDKISLLITINFVTQMLVDLAASKLAPKIGFRLCAVAAHVCCGLGLVLLGLLPFVMPAFAGLALAYTLMAVGGGLIEVLTSPIVDSIPSDSKSAAMSLLHSSYCWGAVAVIALTTLFNFLLPDELWYLLPILWAAVPFANAALFSFVPVPLKEEPGGGRFKKLLTSGIFWLMLLLMIAGGAAEQAIAQWASLFTETGLGVSKATGDLLGVGLFSALMGLSRALYGLFGKRLPLKKTLAVCAVLNLGGFLMTSLCVNPVAAFIGCALCGLSVGMAWPGTLSLSSDRIPGGGATMFALLALGGDIGCALGPGVVGVLGSHLNLLGSELRSGLLLAALFPLIALLLLALLKRKKDKGIRGGQPPEKGVAATEAPAHDRLAETVPSEGIRTSRSDSR